MNLNIFPPVEQIEDPGCSNHGFSIVGSKCGRLSHHHSAQEKIIGQMNLWDNEVREKDGILLRSNYKTRIVRRSQMTTNPTGRSASTTTLARRAL